MEAKLKSVERALKLLECFTVDEPELGVTEISKKLDMHKSTVFNIINTFENCGYLMKSAATGKYKLGLKLLQISYNMYATQDVRKILYPYLKEVSLKTEETVYLGLLCDDEVIYIDAIHSSNNNRMNNNMIGIKAPVYCTGIGKALLSTMTNEEVLKIIPKQLKRFTPNTITDPAVLIEDLEKIRKRGFSIDDMEHEYGIKCVGIALKGVSGQLVCAVSISGPSLRFNYSDIEEYASLLKELKSKVSKLLI